MTLDSLISYRNILSSLPLGSFKLKAGVGRFWKEEVDLGDSIIPLETPARRSESGGQIRGSGQGFRPWFQALRSPLSIEPPRVRQATARKQYLLPHWVR